MSEPTNDDQVRALCEALGLIDKNAAISYVCRKCGNTWLGRASSAYAYCARCNEYKNIDPIDYVDVPAVLLTPSGSARLRAALRKLKINVVVNDNVWHSPPLIEVVLYLPQGDDVGRDAEVIDGDWVRAECEATLNVVMDTYNGKWGLKQLIEAAKQAN